MIGKKILKDIFKVLRRILISFVVLVIGILVLVKSIYSENGPLSIILYTALSILTLYIIIQIFIGLLIRPYLTYVTRNVGKSEFEIRNPHSLIRDEDGEKTTYNKKTTELHSIMLGATFIQKENTIEVIDIHSNGSFYYSHIPKGAIITKVNGEVMTTKELYLLEPKFSDTHTFTITKNGKESSKQVYIVNGGTIRSLINRIGKKAYDRLNDCSDTNTPIAFDTNFLINNYDFLYGLASWQTLIVSRKVFLELDHLKTKDRTSREARAAFRALENIQVDHNHSLIFTPVDEKFTKKIGLDPEVPDDLIIASYLKYEKENNQKIAFISQDRGARLTARSLNLDLLK